MGNIWIVITIDNKNNIFCNHYFKNYNDSVKYLYKLLSSDFRKINDYEYYDIELERKHLIKPLIDLI